MSDTNYPPGTGAREMIAELRSLLGAKLVAYMAGIDTTDTINR